MLRMKYVVGVAVVLAAGLLPVSVAVCETPVPNDAQWDDVGAAGNSLGELAQMGGEEGPPNGMPGMGGGRMGPPPERGAMGRQGPEAGARPMGPPRDGDTVRRPLPGQGPGMPGPGGRMPLYADMPGGPRGPMGMMPNDPEMRELLMKDGQLERDACRLAEQYRQATTEAREKFKKEVEETVTKQFEVRQERRNLELKRLEEQLKDLREAVDKREKARKELIDKRVSRLLGIEKELDF